MLVYVCSPLRASTETEMQYNMAKAREYMHIISQRYNCRAIAPHGFLPMYIDDNVQAERELGLRFGLDLIRLCEKVYVCGDRISEGMRKEINLAQSLGIEIIYLDLEEKSKIKITVIEIEGE